MATFQRKKRKDGQIRLIISAMDGIASAFRAQALFAEPTFHR